MDIVVKDIDNVVVFSGKDLSLTLEGILSPNINCFDITSDGHTLYQNVQIDDNFIVNGCTYIDDVFELNQKGIDAKTEIQNFKNEQRAAEELKQNQENFRKSAEDMVEVFEKMYDMLIEEDPTRIDRMPQVAKDLIANRKALRELIKE